ncbi:MAG: right-handed parallel beta-helix repeat-containing protein [Phycisphaerae bacterium]
MYRGSTVLCAVVASLAGASAHAQTIIHVDDDASVGGDGATWETAFKYLQDALATAASDDEIRVAAGTYKPDQDEGGTVSKGDRLASFGLLRDVGLYGGYRGCPDGDCQGGDPNERDLAVYESFLDGDLNGNDAEVASPNHLYYEPTRVENSYHVVVLYDVSDATVLDGFTIAGGQATGDYEDGYGGGVYSTTTRTAAVRRCILTENAASFGGGMYNFGRARVTGCTFLHNAALYTGGGLFNRTTLSTELNGCRFVGNSATSGGGMSNLEGAAGRITNCSFLENRARGPQAAGGGMYNGSSFPTLVNCLFNANEAEGSDAVGGAIASYGGAPTFVTCTVSGNTAGGNGGGIHNRNGAAPRIWSSVVWGNRDGRGMGETAQILDRDIAITTVRHCCIQDEMPNDAYVFPGEGNIDTAPLFVDPVGPDGVPGTGDEDLSLLPRSPCIDAGDNASVPDDRLDVDADEDTTELTPLDVLQQDRFYDDPCASDVGSPDPLHPKLAIVDMGAYEYQGDPAGDQDDDGLQGCADNCPLLDNAGQEDCDADGLGDRCAIELGASRDCNTNGTPDECDINDGASVDSDDNAVPDECQTVHYVDDNAAFGGDGSTWGTAYRYLQDAQAAAQFGDEIRVAGGTYRPDRDEAGAVVPGDREATFELKSGVALRGGFRGLAAGARSGEDPDERDIEQYETILGGDLNGDDAEVASPDDLQDEPTRAENSYHVVTATAAYPSTLLEGVTITGGNASEPNEHFCGGGLTSDFSSRAIVRDSSFRKNSGYSGGGMCNNEGSRPTVERCTFSLNAARGGGGMRNYDRSDPAVIGCLFESNVATHTDGGGMENRRLSSPALTDCIFERNRADDWGGGMSNYDQCHPSAVDCTFTANRAVREGGGGMSMRARSDPQVIQCAFEANESYRGGGAFVDDDSDPTLDGCWFRGNWANYGGGLGHYDGSAATVSRCMFDRNAANFGGAVHISGSSPTVTQCAVRWNWAYYYGAGFYNIDHGNPTLTQCTLVANSGRYGGGGISSVQDSDPTIVNSVLWDNFPAQFHTSGEGATVTVRSSNVQGGYAGEGNIDADPMFLIRRGRDVRLAPGSPCIDAGDNAAAHEGMATDLAGLPRFADDPCVADTGIGPAPVVDMGAYEFQPSSTCGDGVCDEGESCETCACDCGACCGDGTCATHESCVSCAADCTCRSLEVPGDHDSIQEALDAARDGDEVTVAPGTYHEAIDLLGKAVALRSSHGRAATTIDATGLNTSVVTCVRREAADTLLDGFTITGADASQVGGGLLAAFSSPTVANCDFQWNKAGDGGGIYILYGTSQVTGCTFVENAVDGSGGGIHNNYGDPGVTGCAFVENTARWYGGGMFNLSGQASVVDCSFVRNRAYGAARPKGGGMCNRQGAATTVYACRFYGNAGGYGGGMYNEGSDPLVANSVFVGNDTTFGRGGMYNNYANPTISGCTIIEGGIGNYDGSDTVILNSILRPFGDVYNELGSHTIAYYSNISSGGGGAGNFYVVAGFVRNADRGPDREWGTSDDDYGDLRLVAGSPCVNAGDPDFVPEILETDALGGERVLCGRVDMGAYEGAVGDADCDPAISLRDFAAFQQCFTGPTGGPPATGCEAFDFQYDGSVDLTDYSQVYALANDQ